MFLNFYSLMFVEIGPICYDNHTSKSSHNLMCSTFDYL